MYGLLVLELRDCDLLALYRCEISFEYSFVSSYFYFREVDSRSDLPCRGVVHFDSLRFERVPVLSLVIYSGDLFLACTNKFLVCMPITRAAIVYCVSSLNKLFFL